MIFWKNNHGLNNYIITKMFMNDFQRGGIKALQTIIDYTNNQVAEIKTSNVQPNTPRQITNSGMLKAYNKIIEKCLVKIASIKSQKDPE